MSDCKKNRKVYIVLTYTGTALAKIIKYYTKAEYCHVSLALDENLNKMYSFGRLNPYNPFIGGFVQEGIKTGTFKRFKNTTAAVYSIDLTEKQYKTIRKTIKWFKKNKKEYSFNIIGLFASGFNFKYQKERSFYCAEFVKYLIDKAELELDLPELIKPIDFKNLDKLELQYSGKLQNYKLIND